MSKFLIQFPFSVRRRRGVGRALQEVGKLGQCREGVETGVQDCNVEVWRAGGGLAEGGAGFVDLEAGAEGRWGCGVSVLEAPRLFGVGWETGVVPWDDREAAVDVVCCTLASKPLNGSCLLTITAI